MSTVWDRWRKLMETGTTSHLEKFEDTDGFIREQFFDDITALAAEICNCPTSLISLVDTDNRKLLFKSMYGNMLEGYTTFPIENPAHIYCVQNVLNTTDNKLFEVRDSAEHPELSVAPATSALGIKFYAAMHVIVDGIKVGSFCVMDKKPRQSGLDDSQRLMMETLCNQLNAHIRMRCEANEALKEQEQLLDRRQHLSILAGTISHDVRQPLSSVILGTDDIIRRGYKDDNLFSILESASKIKTIVDKMLQFVVIENDQSTKELGNSKEQLRPQVVNNEAVANIHKSDTIQKFLIVDDNRTSLKIMSEIIRSSGHLVKTAEDGQKCLDLLNECGLTFFDVLIIDEEMPFLTGSEVIAKLREMERSTGTRMFVISSSGHNDASFIKYIKECGADEVLMKPFKRDELFRMCGISIDKKLL
ncbi:hypothetical protein AKO1_015084 [Acrasis kona]|uniref:Response regulatory domain-containing protein n=1 Tax=Acrasis kona TaxID=1008807 RepID=A0AAW2YRG7_9EUKA